MSCEGWKESIAEEYCESVRDGTHDSPKAVLGDKGRFLITSKHLGDYEINFQNAYKISFSDYEKVIERSKVDQWDILFSMIGTIGKIYQEKSLQPNYAIKNVAVFKLGHDKNRSNWLKYYLKSPSAQKYIFTHLRGSTQSYIPLDSLRKLRIKYPEEIEQKAIAATLSCLDDKIELNNQMNDTLEQMAQAIFKSWFVDYEPFQDGEFEDSELGKIPKGWKVKPLYDSAEFINGTSFKKDEYSTSGIPIIKISELKNGITDTTQYFDGERDGKYYLQTGDMLFSWSGSPQTSIDTFIWVGNKAVLNQHTFKIKILNNDYSFVYLLLKFFKSKFIRIAMGKQTTGLGHVTVKDLKQIYFPYDKETVESFTIMINPLITKYIGNLIENKRLSSLRDALLPKLMSGEIRVPVESAE